MLTVIADDITGAAEVAGIAFERGLRTRLAIVNGAAAAVPVGTPCDVLVIATDTRSFTEQEAAAETRRLARLLVGGSVASESGGALAVPPLRLFKKTDSALRGHVEAELEALLRLTHYQTAVYVPANPSKGRIVRDGTYYLRQPAADGTSAAERPIEQTDFAFDPEFPARTSTLAERFPHAEALHISMPDATTKADIDAIVSRIGHDTLPAGAADLFASYLAFHNPHTPTVKPAQPAATANGVKLLLCGSTQSRALSLGMPVAAMPVTVYDGSTDIGQWLSEATLLYKEGRGLILTIPHHHRTGKAVANHLRTVMARMAAALVAMQQPEELIVEGGATAFATLQQLGWHQLEVHQQVAPGVVRLRADSGTLVTLKPGSYPWGPLFG